MLSWKLILEQNLLKPRGYKIAIIRANLSQQVRSKVIQFPMSYALVMQIS